MSGWSGIEDVRQSAWKEKSKQPLDTSRSASGPQKLSLIDHFHDQTYVQSELSLSISCHGQSVTCVR